MLNIVAPDQNQAPAAVERCRINDGQSWLAPAPAAARNPLAAKSAHKPQRQCKKGEHHHEGEQHLEPILPLAKQGAEHHSSPLRWRGIPSGQWLTRRNQYEQRIKNIKWLTTSSV